jgi:hypothetical protein
MFGSRLGAFAFGVGLGTILLAIGIAVAANWRRCAERYTDWTDAFAPQTRLTTTDRWPRMLRQNRIIFGVIAAFGGALLLTGIVTLLAEI